MNSRRNHGQSDDAPGGPVPNSNRGMEFPACRDISDPHPRPRNNTKFGGSLAAISVRNMVSMFAGRHPMISFGNRGQPTDAPVGRCLSPTLSEFPRTPRAKWGGWAPVSKHVLFAESRERRRSVPPIYIMGGGAGLEVRRMAEVHFGFDRIADAPVVGRRGGLHSCPHRGFCAVRLDANLAAAGYLSRQVLGSPPP